MTIFISHCYADAEHLERLEKHLAVLKRQGLVNTWHTGRVLAGEEADTRSAVQLETARIVLLLVSADYLAADPSWQQIQRGLERHERGEARVIPILVRSCDWKGAPFCKLKALPENNEPVTKWRDSDDAWTSVVQGIGAVVGEIGTQKPSESEASHEQPGVVESGNLLAIIRAYRASIIETAASVKREVALVAMRALREIEKTFVAVYENRRDDPSYPSTATIECAHAAAFAVMDKSPQLLAAFDSDVRHIVEQAFFVGYLCGVHRRPFFDVAPVKGRSLKYGNKLWSTLDLVLDNARNDKFAHGSVEAADAAQIIVEAFCKLGVLDTLREPMGNAAYFGVSIAVAEEYLGAKTRRRGPT
ncbi:toll/interleukin-1 receptor domain-containing protein [Polyangium aurulentum]|uniref:toll/interleukin-1 receptor domain-containing protein n=1 Tax=Polyangium aurulentum TaxID=2567896 RepID=UPI00146AA763|nr:toll/interleukin-1 receptor domain-containing protein [Polyangium aurulentum]UQA61776.1 toll/interleukin-1 receptor domain-containing protein [Polyangium aurulentum]